MDKVAPMTMDQVGAVPEPANDSDADDQSKPSMPGPMFDDVGADQIGSAGTAPSSYDIGNVTMDNNAFVSQHNAPSDHLIDLNANLGTTVPSDSDTSNSDAATVPKLTDDSDYYDTATTTAAEGSVPDQLFILDAGTLMNAAKCTEGQYKGEICLAPPDGYPVTENGKLSAKRVRAAISYGSKGGKLSTLKKNGLCNYAKKAGVDSTYCGGGTQESVVKQASTYEDQKIQAFEQNNKLFIKAFLLDSSVNLNQWGVSASTLDANINSYIGKPIVLQSDFQHPNSGDDNLHHQLSYQELFRIGTIIDINKKGSVYHAIAEITDDNAKKAFLTGALSLYVSPQLYHLAGDREPQNNMTMWTGTHLAIVKEPAFGIRKANVGSQCTGNGQTCLAQLKKASIIKDKGYGNCGYCNFKVLMSAAKMETKPLLS
jgi:DNA-directed RNA polymerase subunit RPC12/RpoP